MTEPHPDGWRRHDREDVGKRDPDERVQDFEEIWASEWDEEQLQAQSERCMDCAVPTCMGGCPIGNVIPDWNDLIYRDDWKAALNRLHATNNFPEFTGYTCPAPCEPSCVLAVNDDPVTIKSIERAIVDRGWEEGWIEPHPPDERTGHHVAVVGSGPAGLAAAQQLNRAGHTVTVFERDDEVGGLMRYGIPDFKFAKERVDRRVDQLRQEGIGFRTNAEIGSDVPIENVIRDYDATCLAVGAQHQRDVDLPGRDLDGIHFAMDYLIEENRRQAGKAVKRDVHAAGKHVVVLGGGDTGADCVATAHRQGADQVVQIDINRKPPETRPTDNPWPEQPKTYRKTYAQEEDGIEAFGIKTHAFVDRNGDGRVEYLRAERVEWTYDDEGNRAERSVIDPDLEIPADLVLIAVGFEGAEANPFLELGVETASDGTIRTDGRKMTDVEGVFAAGDATRGQSLVVWAIGEGRDVARHVDIYLTGDSDLPPSLETPNPPLID
jgi:glutamate synthase (NADPH/NADH) small chain